MDAAAYARLGYAGAVTLDKSFGAYVLEFEQ